MECLLMDQEDTRENCFPRTPLPVLVALINQKNIVTGKDDFVVIGGKEDLVAVVCKCLMMKLFQRFLSNLVNTISLVACRGALFLKGPPGRGVIGHRLRS